MAHLVPPPPSDEGPPPPPPVGEWGPTSQPEWGPTSQPEWGPPPPGDQPKRRSGRAVLIAVLLVVGGAGGTVALLASDGDEPATVTSLDPSATVTSLAPGAETTVPPDPGDLTASSGIDPAIGWRRVGHGQFAEPGEQRMDDVVAFGDLLVAGGSSLTYGPVPFSIPLSGGGPVTLAGWEISVTAVEPDAAALIAAHDPGNEPAPDGVRYLMVTLQVTNLLDEQFRNVWADVDMFLAAPDGTPLTSGAYCASTLPDDLRAGPFDPGGTNTGNECFALLDDRVRDGMVVAFAPAGFDRTDLDGALWTSPDGESWSRVVDADLIGPGNQAITHVVAFGDHIYAGGMADGDGRDVALWRAGDGRTWDRIDAAALGGPGDQWLFDLVEVDGTLFAAGASAPPLGPGEVTESWNQRLRDDYLNRIDRRRAVLWRSDDGTVWNRVDLGSFGSTLRHIDMVARHEGRMILVGRHIDGDLAVVSSLDLMAWEPAALEPADTDGWTLRASAVLEGRLHVLGRPGALSTSDGTTWSLGPLSFVSDVTRAGDVLLGVGRAGGREVLGPIDVERHRPALSVMHADGSRSAILAPDLLPEGTVGEMVAVSAWGDRYVAVGLAGADASVWIGGAPAGSVTAEFLDADPIYPDPPVPEQSAPTADLVHFDGEAWEVLDLGDDLPEAVATTFDAVDSFSRFLARDGLGRLWVASSGGGVHRLDAGGWTRFDRDDGLPSLQIQDMETDHTGTVWVGTAAGPAFFDGARWQGVALPDAVATPHVMEVLAASDGTLWVGCLGGLGRWDGTTWNAFTMADGLPSSVVTDVQEGAAGIWVVTPAGLGHWDGVAWQTFTDPSHRPYFDAYPYVSLLDTAIYFAPGIPPGSDTYRSDLIRLQPDGTRQVLMSSSSYKALALTPQGTLYAGTDINGLFVVGAGVDNVGSIEGVSLIHIGELWVAPTGEVWMDAGQGLFQIHSVGVVTRHTDIPGLGYQLIAPDEGFGDGAVQDLVFGSGAELWAIVNEQSREW